MSFLNMEILSLTDWVAALPGDGEMPISSFRRCLHPGHCHTPVL